MVSSPLRSHGLPTVEYLDQWTLCALFVVINQTPNLKMLGLLQGFAAGLMLSISFLDLAHNAINSIGFLKGNIWFFGGVIFFAVVANFIPEPTIAPVSDVKSKKVSKWQAFKLATLSGLAEPLGVIIVVGGVMAFLTLHEMLPLAFDYAGQKQAVKAVFFGMAFMSASLYFLEISLPAEMSM
ncbi:zinc transporter ztp29 [Phtheirospermum japonicum]|uniref:Zinc transporter ztp29 n=1 Tax=Phtheirospermum japonicum TaxID=374723 RepID=A0A830AZH8_9LAMI|nr:zinc transporter ztp29 [Phtheirospermum japonicum]